MQSAVLKIAALLSVIGIGGFAVYEVHKRLQVEPAAVDPAGFKPLADGDGAAGQGETENPPGSAQDT